MKARDFLSQVANKAEIINKIKDFKEGLRRLEVLRRFESCAQCGGALSYSARTDYLMYEVQEQVSCTACAQKGPSRRFTLN